MAPVEEPLVSLHDREAMSQLRRRLRLDPHRLKRFRQALYVKGLSVGDCLLEIPVAQRAAFADSLSETSLKLVERRDSQDGATKLLLEADDGGRLETVVLRSPSGRCAVCVSSQIGCAAGCRFCATSYLGRRRNLTVAEIIDQVLWGNQILRQEQRRIRNLVFMGMGEPFHNEAVVFQSLEMLHDLEHFGMAPRRTLVSTVGVPDALVRCAARFRRSPLAVSLHSAIEEKRQSLIPIARACPLPRLREAMRRTTAIQGVPLMVEYVMLSGVNDGQEDLDALVEFVRELPVLVNLIPYNVIPEAPQLVGSTRETRHEFANQLRRHGLLVTIRNSLGDEIGAACGQLALRRAGQPLGT